MFKRAVIGTYRELIYAQRREVAFWVLAAFLPTFIIARLLVHYAPGLFLGIDGTHVHHFTYGIVILAVSGYAALVSPRQAKPWLAALYGVGLALSFDEFGMWLRLTNNYYNRQSYDAVIVIAGFLIAVVYFVDVWRVVGRRLLSRR